MVRAIRRAQAAVVDIHSEKAAPEREGRKINGMGTGIIVDERGYIVTNQHVVADVTNLRVTLADGGMYDARVVSFDKQHDLAIIRIHATKPLAVMPRGISSDLMLGETVIAVGNPFGYEHTVTAGIVSALGRNVDVNEKQSYRNLIQTDASINPGNSGGPLLNLDGEVVGINVAIRAGAQRIGFAIPIDDARVLIAKLLNIRKLNDTYHGLVAHDAKADNRIRLVVKSAELNSPAYAAGFQAGDVVIQADRIPVCDQADLERAFLGHAAGDKVPVVVKRDSGETTLTIELAKASPAITETVRTEFRAPTGDVTDQQSWQLLGLKLSKISDARLKELDPNYSGGDECLLVEDVRAGSPADRWEIQKGDILVSLHKFYTAKKEDVRYILNELRSTTEPVDFQVVRARTLYKGRLQLR